MGKRSTPTGYFYEPDLGATGDDEKDNFNAGLDLADAAITSHGTSIVSLTASIAGLQPALGYTPAHAGANSDITSLSGLTTPLPTDEGGTGTVSPANTASGAVILDSSGKLPALDGSQLFNIPGGVSQVTGSGNIASSGGNTPDITFTGVLPIANGGTAMANVGGVANRVMMTTDGSTLSMGLVNLTNEVTGTLPVGNGGTGATAASNTANGVLILDSGGLIPSTLLPSSAVIKQFFSASGTFTAPTGVTRVYITMVGAGGGGGCTAAAGNGGGGGGSGAWIIKFPYTVTPGNSYTVTLNNAGSGGSSNNPGGNGGTSVFDTLTVNGGTGGSAVSTGGAGGSASPGVPSGGIGEPGVTGATTSSNVGGGGGGGPLGKGGNGGATTGANGSNATSYGAGGGGSGNECSGHGGNGSKGCVLVEW